MIARSLRCAFLAALLLAAAAAPAVRAADAPPAADAEAAALLAQHAAHVGWRSGDGTLKTLRESGEQTRGGKRVRQFERLQMGLIYRSSRTGEAGTFEDGFTGRVFWQTNENGFTTPDAGEVVQYLVTSVQVADEGLTSLPGTVRGSLTIDGVRTKIVRVVAAGGLPVDVFIDPADGAYKRIVIDPGGKYEEGIDVLSETDVGGGKRVLSAWRYVGGTSTFTYTKIEANAEVTADELHPPKPAASWTFGPPAQAIPIDVTDHGIYLNAEVNGHRGHFIFDTGADGIAFTDSFARSTGAKRVGETRIEGIGGGSRANIYHVDTIAFGPSTLHDVRIATGLDERGGAGRDGYVDGLIGFDLLAGAVVEMDLDAKTMRILDPALVAPDHAQGITLHIDLSTGQPRFPMTVGGRAAVLTTLDSGDSFYVLFSSKLVSAGHVRFSSLGNVLASRIEFEGVNGRETDECGQLDSLELGPIVYRPVPACMSDSMSFNDVLVGFDFFKNLNYVFDYPDGEILVSARTSH